MALGPRLDLRQTQGLVMTPQLQQAIRLLQFSSLELSDFVERELETNPLLERDETAPGSAVTEAMGNDDDRTEDGLTVVDSSEEIVDVPLDVDGGASANEAAYDDTGEMPSGPAYEGGSYEGGGYQSSGDYDSLPDLEQTLSEATDLRSHLEQQVNLAFNAPSDRLIGTFLIDQLDESGYLAATLDEIAGQLGADTQAVEQVLKVMQGFDPAGLFARDLKECLALQLKDRNRFDPAMAALIDNLDLLAARNFKRLTGLCGVDTEDLEEMVAEIKALDPKPALRFDRDISQTVIPDVLMTPLPAGGWRLDLNPDTLPRVLVNHAYHAELTAAAGGKSEKAFVAEKFQSATWLIRALEQRATTILKVATEIVRQQDGFFRKGVTHLKPLVLRDIAEETELHESTVSRVTSNKYIATPRGIYELKYFFSHGLTPGVNGEAMSAEAVRHRIKQLIDAETADAVLSDDQLVSLLEKDGITVARRTVAKYREALRIPSSVKRRREKATSL